MEKDKTFSVSVESGVLAIGDPSIQKRDVSPDDLIDLTKEGVALYCATGGDGIFGVILRESTNFQIQPGDGVKVSSLSSPLLINLPGGVVNVADMYELANTSDENSLKVSPGIYECMVHLCQNEETKFFGFIVILNKSEKKEAQNSNVWEIEQLG